MKFSGRALFFLVILSELALLFSSVCVTQASIPSGPEFTLEHVDNSLEATIKNSLGASYYNFRFKDKNENEWNYYPIDPTSTRGYNTYDAYNNSVPYEATNSDYTIVKLPSVNFDNLPLGSEVEVQIQALIGDYKKVVYGFSAPLPTYDYYFEGTISNWSETQTVILSENAQTTDSIPEFPSWIVLPLFLIATSTIVVYKKKLWRQPL